MKHNAPTIIPMAFNIAAVVFFIVSSFFLLFFMGENYFFPTQTVFNMPGMTASVIVAPSTNPINEISNETLLAVLTLLVVFAGLQTYIFERLVQNDIKTEYEEKTDLLQKEIQKQAEWERQANLAYAKFSIGLSLIQNYLYHFSKDQGAIKERRVFNFSREERVLIEYSELATRQAVVAATGLPTDKYKDITLSSRNNLAYILSIRWAHLQRSGVWPEDELTLDEDRRSALIHSSYVYEHSRHRKEEQRRFPLTNKEHSLAFIHYATHALVLIVFNQDVSNDLEEARRMVWNLLYDNTENSPPQQMRQELRERFQYLWNLILGPEMFQTLIESLDPSTPPI